MGRESRRERPTSMRPIDSASPTSRRDRRGRILAGNRRWTERPRSSTLRSKAARVRFLPPRRGVPLIVDRYCVMQEMEPLVASLLSTLRPVEECWQPSDLLPRTDVHDWRDGVAALRSEADRLTDEMLVVLVGNVVTEEALP